MGDGSRIALVALVVLTLWASVRPAHAVLSISICGHSTYTCKSDETWKGPDGFTTLGGDAGSLKVTDGSGNTAVIPLNPQTKLNTPSGWLTPTTPQIDPVAPSTAASLNNVTSCSWFNGTGNGSFGAEPGGASGCMASLISAYNAQTCPANRSVTMTMGAVNEAADSFLVTRADCETGAPLSDISGSYNTAVTCPAGYTLSGSVCNKTNNLNVVKPADNSIGVRRVGNAFVPDAADADVTSGAAATALAAVISGSVATIGSTALGGTVSVTIAGDGSSVVTLAIPGPGTTAVTRVGLSAPNGSTGAVSVSGFAVGTVQGSGSEQGENPAPDLASSREATQLGVKAALDTIVADGVKVNEQAGSWSGAKAAADTAIASTASGYAAHEAKFTPGGGIPGLETYVPPSNHEQGSLWHTIFPMPTTCAPLVFDWRGGLTVDVCPIVNYLRPILDWGMFAMTVLYLYSLLWRQRSAVAG